MGYLMSNGRWANCVDLTLLASATKTTTGNGDAVEVGDARCARVTLEATAVSGTDPGLTVSLQGSPDGTNWYTIGAFTEVTDTGSERKVFPCDRFLRAAWAITGEDTGSCSAVTQTGDGPVVTVSGTPAADAEFVVEVTTGGARSALVFRWSDDGGETWTSDVSGAATVELGESGVTAAFSAETAGTNTAVTQTGDGPAVTLTGEPADDYTGEIEITTGGHRGTAVFKWTSDGETYTENVTTGATCVLGATGITANFAAETAGTVGALTQSGTGPLITITGDPDDAYDLQIEVDLGGDRGTATFRWSLDGGANWEAEDVLTAATVALGTTGMTANFPDGSYVLAETYDWDTTAPIDYEVGTTYSWASTAPVDYVDGTTYEWTADDPDPDTSVTFSVTGETV